jgi:hypothetical protein
MVNNVVVTCGNALSDGYPLQLAAQGLIHLGDASPFPAREGIQLQRRFFLARTSRDCHFEPREKSFFDSLASGFGRIFWRAALRAGSPSIDELGNVVIDVAPVGAGHVMALDHLLAFFPAVGFELPQGRSHDLKLCRAHQIQAQPQQ